jgi:hypothetical protein
MTIRRHARLATAVLIGLSLLPAPYAGADDTGIAQALWTIKREGKRACIQDHTHDGYSSGVASRKAAEQQAVKAWAEFTAWEYGTDWAQWTKAAGKRLSCSQGSDGWGCHAEARPCK